MQVFSNIDDVGQGTAVVLVHGFPLNRQMWQAQRPLASSARLISFDLPGFGAAPPPATPSVAAYAEAVRAVLDDRGLERAVVCGLSMGGYVLFELWRRHPHRVAGLVLADTRAEPDGPEQRQARLTGIADVRAGRRQVVTGPLLDKLLAPRSANREAVAAAARTMMDQVPDDGVIAALQAMHDRPDSVPTLPTINVPTLVVVGAEDTLTPPAVARTISDAIPDSRLRILPGAGHLSPMETPDAFNAALTELLRVL